jgi:hypothetical protein
VDVYLVGEPPPPLDLATGDGTYRRKPRLRTVRRPVHPVLAVVAALSILAALLVGAGWYATDSRTQRAPRSAQGQPISVPEPMPLPSIVVDDPMDPGLTVPVCRYRTPDHASLAKLPATVDRVPGQTPRLVLRTNRGRIVFLLNGWAGGCAIDSTVSVAAAHMFDGVRCAPVPKAKALRCKVSAGHVYEPQLVDLRTGVEASTIVDKDGTVHVVFPEGSPEPVAAGKRGGLLTVVAGPDGFAGGDVVLAYADTTLPAGSFYPTIGEIYEGADLLSRIGSGLTITSATVE